MRKGALCLAIAVSVLFVQTAAAASQGKDRDKGSSTEEQSRPIGPQAKSKEELDAYVAIQKEVNATNRLALADAFLRTYPDSELKGFVYRYQMEEYSHLGKNKEAIAAAERGLAFESATIGRLKIPSLMGTPPSKSPEGQRLIQEFSKTKLYYLRNMMNTSYNMNDAAKTVEYAVKALEVDPEDLLSLLTLSSVLAERPPTDEKEREKQIKRAEEIAKKARAKIEAVMSSPSAMQMTETQKGDLQSHSHQTMGLIYLNQRRYAEAQKEYALALRLKRDDPVSYYRLGIAYAQDRKVDEAIGSLAKSVFLKGITEKPARELLEKLYQTEYKSLDGLDEFIAEAGRTVTGNDPLTMVKLTRPAAKREPTAGRTVPAGFPSLAYDVKLDDANANKVLDGGERFTLRVEVRNSGIAAAGDVRVRIRGDPMVLSAITPEQQVGDIPPGQTKIAEFRGVVPIQAATRNAEIEVSLSEGANELPQVQVLRVGLARTEVRRTTTVLSEVIDVDDPPNAVPLPDRSSSFAVVIGISSYREAGIPSVPFATRDAEIMVKYLENVAGVRRENIKILANERAGRVDIEEAIEEWLSRRTTEKSSVVIYYAGHGALDPATGEAYLVPYEGHPDSPTTRLYPLKRLYEKLENLKSREVTVFLDSCFSGGGRSIAMRARPLVITSANLVLESKKLIVLAGAAGNQVSSDLDRWKHGLFTYFLLKAARGEADEDRDGWVDLAELYAFVRNNVASTALSELNREQTPVLTGGSDVNSRAKTLKLFRTAK